MEKLIDESPNSNRESTSSQRPTAFTIDFGNEKKIDTQRQKTLAEKFQKKREKSLSKRDSDLADEPSNSSDQTVVKNKHKFSSDLRRKSSFRLEESEKPRSSKPVIKRSDLTLSLKNTSASRMTQSFPNSVSHSSPIKKATTISTDLPLNFNLNKCTLQNYSNAEPIRPKNDLVECKQDIGIVKRHIEDKQEQCFALTELDNSDRKSDTVSEAGTYTLSMDNYSEEQKAKMSIDNEFKIEQISLMKKTEDYIKSLSQQFNQLSPQFQSSEMDELKLLEDQHNSKSLQNFCDLPSNQENLQTPLISKLFLSNKAVSPTLSPTSQNLSIANESNKFNDEFAIKYSTDDYLKIPNTTFAKAHTKNSPESLVDEGTIISVTSSGAFRSKNEDTNRMRRQLVKTEVRTETYVNGKTDQVNNNNNNNNKMQNNYCEQKKLNRLTANIINVQNIEIKSNADAVTEDGRKKLNGASSSASASPSNKLFHSKIPSPIHSLSHPRSSFISTSSSTDDLDTEFILKPTQNYITQLQHKLSLDDSDPDSDYDMKYDLQLNNTAHLLKQKALHIRHNSLDERIMKNNKLEHFQNKNLQGNIDQVYGHNVLLNQYKQVNKLNNSPSGSPIRKSSSFSNRTQIKMTKNTNNISNNTISTAKPSSATSVYKKAGNLSQSPNLSYNKNNIQRSSSTASIKPNFLINKKPTTNPGHRKIDRSKFGDTESSSEEDFGNAQPPRRKDLSGNIWNTRCNRTFGLRRARFDGIDKEPTRLKCPNTPDMRRKIFHPEQKPERSLSVDRKPVKSNEVQSRYLLNINKRNPPPSTPVATARHVSQKPTTVSSKASLSRESKSSPFNRTDAGQSSKRIGSAHGSGKPPTPNFALKNDRRDEKHSNQSNGARSNSSLSSKEMEFQNWKRRKSYDPMKAAAEGKRKEMQKKLSGMTSSYTESVSKATNQESPDSSQSHSGSVYRSQSFQGTAALEQLISSEDELTLSVDELSPPTPSPCELSPARARLKYNLWDRIHN